MPSDASLPESIEERLYQAYFDCPSGEREGAVDALCREFPEHEPAIRSQSRDLMRSERLLGSVHDTLHEAGDWSRVGPFEIERVLGEGGFGTVYLATQHEPVRRRVALKVLRAGRTDPRALRRVVAGKDFGCGQYRGFKSRQPSTPGIV